jgi:hypothetical protein
MPDSRARELIRIGKALYSDREDLLSLWQEIALNCYPERATFTTDESKGAEFADHLFGSYPSMARRELGNSYSAILRPTNVPWFEAHVSDEDKDKHPPHRAYLEYLTRVMRRAMYDPPAQFVRSTKQADHDLAAFGNAALEARTSPDRSRLVYRSFHLRDVAWSENVTGLIDVVFRRWLPSARQLYELWPDKVSAEVKKANEKDPERKFSVLHMVVPTRLYQPDAKPLQKAQPFTCLYIEETSETVLEEVPEPWLSFVIPRWQTISGTPYARSPATEIALPDSRTFQAMVRTLREAGEMHVNPPMVAVTDAVRGDIQLFAGGVTAIDIEYDEKAGPALRALERGAPGTMPIGIEMANQVRDDIRLGYYLDKLQLPKIDPQKMTAYEFQKRIEQMAREGAPIFDPIEDDYNAPLCDLTFTIMKANGAFGPPSDVPAGLRGDNLKWNFRSPYREATEQAKAGLFIDGLQRVLGPAAQIDPAQLENIDLTQAVRDSLHGLGYPETWFKPPDAVAQKQMAKQRQEEMAAGLAATGGAGQAAQSVGKGASAVATGIQNLVAPTPAQPG